MMLPMFSELMAYISEKTAMCKTVDTLMVYTKQKSGWVAGEKWRMRKSIEGDMRNQKN